MKQYDKIWVPDEDGDYEVCDVEYIAPERGRVSPESNVVVIPESVYKGLIDWMDKRVSECRSYQKLIDPRSLKYETIDSEVNTIERIKRKLLTPPPTKLS